MSRRLALLAVLAIACLGFGSSSAMAQGGSCSGAYSTATWSAGGAILWQGGMYCTISGVARIDKVQFYWGETVDYSNNTIYSASVDNFVVNVNANGFVGYNFQHAPGWCAPGGHSMVTDYYYKIHQWYENSWGPPHRVYSGQAIMDCHT